MRIIEELPPGAFQSGVTWLIVGSSTKILGNAASQRAALEGAAQRGGSSTEGGAMALFILMTRLARGSVKDAHTRRAMSP